MPGLLSLGKKRQIERKKKKEQANKKNLVMFSDYNLQVARCEHLNLRYNTAPPPRHLSPNSSAHRSMNIRSDDIVIFSDVCAYLCSWFMRFVKTGAKTVNIRTLHIALICRRLHKLRCTAYFQVKCSAVHIITRLAHCVLQHQIG